MQPVKTREPALAKREAQAPWRFGSSWPSDYLRTFIAELAQRKTNYGEPPENLTEEAGWTVDGAESSLGFEPPGAPVVDGLFERAKQGILNYDFSDPRIVVGHFDPKSPLIGRNIALEIKVLGLRFLGGARVMDAREENTAAESVFGFRYDTLEGHFERGFEWFLLTKNHATGEVRFKIEAHWRVGLFPNWWSKMGFLLIGQFYRRWWRNLAPGRLKELARKPLSKPTAGPDGLAHRGDIEPQRTQASQGPSSGGTK